MRVRRQICGGSHDRVTDGWVEFSQELNPRIVVHATDATKGMLPLYDEQIVIIIPTREVGDDLANCRQIRSGRLPLCHSGK